MCLLAILHRVVEDAPLIVAANREEAYARGGTPPRLVDSGVRFVAGTDPETGGTWLGINAFGVIVAVTNRFKSKVAARPRSRGLLARDLLACRTAQEASWEAARELGKNLYAGCNVFCGDAVSAQVVHGGDWLRMQPLPPGHHVLAAGDLNDGTNRRVAYSLSWLHERQFPLAADWLAALKELCGSTGADGGPPITLHGEKGGTVSSSLIALRTPLARSTYLHAQGPPDSTPYEDYSQLVVQLS